MSYLGRLVARARGTTDHVRAVLPVRREAADDIVVDDRAPPAMPPAAVRPEPAPRAREPEHAAAHEPEHAAAHEHDPDRELSIAESLREAPSPAPPAQPPPPAPVPLVAAPAPPIAERDGRARAAAAPPPPTPPPEVPPAAPSPPARREPHAVETLRETQVVRTETELVRERAPAEPPAREAGERTAVRRLLAVPAPRTAAPRTETAAAPLVPRLAAAAPLPPPPPRPAPALVIGAIHVDVVAAPPPPRPTAPAPAPRPGAATPAAAPAVAPRTHVLGFGLGQV